MAHPKWRSVIQDSNHSLYNGRHDVIKGKEVVENRAEPGMRGARSAGYTFSGGISSQVCANANPSFA